MKVLGRDELLSGKSIKRELVPVPELDGEMWMRDLGTGVLIFNNRIKDLRDSGQKETTPEISLELMALLVSLSACDESGALLFSEEDVKALTNNNVGMLSRLGTKALELSGLKLGALSELTSEVAENLPNALTTSLSSNLPTNSRKRKRK